MKMLLAVVAVGLLLAADKPKDDAGKEDLEKLQGSWQAVEGERNGEKAPEDQIKKVTATFKGDKVTVKRGDTTESEQTVTLDPTKNPKTIDVTPDSKGIYELDGDTLKVRYSKEGTERPTKLTGKTKEGEIQIIFKRAKP